MFPLTPLLFALASLAISDAASPCDPKKIKAPQVFGTEILDISAEEVKDDDSWDSRFGIMIFTEKKAVSYCNFTVTYTHSGLNDTVHVDVVLPLSSSDWNGRYVSQGGGGFSAGQSKGGLGVWVANGYASATTDAGHDKEQFSSAASADWALLSPGNVDLNALENFGSRSLGDLASIGKQVTQSFYGKKPSYSYWNGCSTGGRQGLMSAQRFPDEYDGILSAAPAVNWTPFVVAGFWGQLKMKQLGVYPPACEFNAITAAAIEACDELDGVKDGLISAHGDCHFDPSTVVGKEIDCKGKPLKISKEAAQVAKAVWDGPRDEAGIKWWHGLGHETSFNIEALAWLGGLVMTDCTGAGGKCGPMPFPIMVEWYRAFLAKDPKFDINQMTEEEFFNFMRQSTQQYYSIMGSADSDLSRFQKHGGKIMMWHGLADQVIYSNGSLQYYQRVLEDEHNSNVRDWFRYFEAPGVTHCFGGAGPFPGWAFDSLVEWVEGGKAPDSIHAVTVPNPFTDKVLKMSRPLCAWPKVPAYKGGDANDAAAYECADSFDAFGKTATVTEVTPEAEETAPPIKDEL